MNPGDMRLFRTNAFFTVLPAVLLTLPLIGCHQKVGNSTNEPAVPKVIEITDANNVSMVVLPGGAFTMGNASGADTEKPAHEVMLSPFAIDKVEVTQIQFANLELPNPSNFKGDDNPVDQVRWNEAAEFCNERSKAEGLEPCYDLSTFRCDFEASGYRLPTEAEWEYAARSGTTGDYYFSGGSSKLTSNACYAGNSEKRTTAAGSKRPNAFGLFDMLGNVAEWCNDPYAADYYANSPRTDPRGPVDGPKRVLRGGSWKSDPDECRVTSRQFDDSGIHDACFARNYVGFRCVRRLSEDERKMLD